MIIKFDLKLYNMATGWAKKRGHSVISIIPCKVLTTEDNYMTLHTHQEKCIPGLLISKYRVLPILYRRYFINIDGLIANTSEKSYR